MDNTIDILIERVSSHLDMLKSLKPAQIKGLIMELKKENGVWSKLASGNRDYLENALKYNTDKALIGAIPHLAQALPHRLGFIASAETTFDTIGDPVFDSVILGRISLNTLKPLELVQFLRDFLNSQKIPKGWGMFSNYARTVKTWVDSFDKRHANDAKSAFAYIEEKRPKIINLFTEAIFPQMLGAIARQQA